MKAPYRIIGSMILITLACVGIGYTSAVISRVACENHTARFLAADKMKGEKFYVNWQTMIRNIYSDKWARQLSNTSFPPLHLTVARCVTAAARFHTLIRAGDPQASPEERSLGRL